MTAFYNEHDPYAAAWLRNLIAAGHIAPGIVDERDIRDVCASDLVGFTQCHFFAGIGVWSYALRLAGWPDDRPVWTGSCPCQPLSSAGLGLGHADERHLWPAFHGRIAERRPAVLFGEQVASADGREWFSAVRSDLEHLGYACGAADLAAAGIGAPHKRNRIFFVADALRGGAGAGAEPPAQPAAVGTRRWQRSQSRDDGNARHVADAAGERWDRTELSGASETPEGRGAERGVRVDDARSARRPGDPVAGAGLRARGDWAVRAESLHLMQRQFFQGQEYRLGGPMRVAG